MPAEVVAVNPYVALGEAYGILWDGWYDQMQRDLVDTDENQAVEAHRLRLRLRKYRDAAEPWRTSWVSSQASRRKAQADLEGAGATLNTAADLVETVYGLSLKDNRLRRLAEIIAVNAAKGAAESGTVRRPNIVDRAADAVETAVDPVLPALGPLGLGIGVTVVLVLAVVLLGPALGAGLGGGAAAAAGGLANARKRLT